jgi:hypothetical protein
VCWCSFTSSIERNPDTRRVPHQAAVAVLTDVLQKLAGGGDPPRRTFYVADRQEARTGHGQGAVIQALRCACSWGAIVFESPTVLDLRGDDLPYGFTRDQSQRVPTATNFLEGNFWLVSPDSHLRVMR